MLLGSVLMGSVLLTAGATIGAAPASAHTELVSSKPADGSTSDVAPSRIVLTFNETPASITSVRAERSNGTPVELGAPEISGRKVVVAWPATQIAGVYRIVYDLVSDDGDPVTGTLVFGYRAARTATPGAITDSASADPVPASTSASPSSPASPTPAPSTTSGASDPAAASGTSAPGAGGLPGWVVALVAAALVLGLTVLVLRRGRRDGSSNT